MAAGPLRECAALRDLQSQFQPGDIALGDSLYGTYFEIALLAAAGAVKVADAADGIDQRAGLDQQLAHFAQEVVQVIGLDDVGQGFLFQDRLGVADRQHRHQE